MSRSVKMGAMMGTCMFSFAPFETIASNLVLTTIFLAVGMIMGFIGGMQLLRTIMKWTFF
jgi:hypothetical protein